jgi:hypothetical protein
MARDRARGRVFYGAPVLRPKVTALSTGTRVATITDCQDATHTGDKDAKTGRLLTKGSPRTTVVATMNLQRDGEWRVVYVTFPKQRC